jgi:hypothetical protein
LRESDRERKLLRLGLRCDRPNPPVGDAELACQSRYAPFHRLDVVGAEMRAAAVELAVLRHQLGPVLGQVLEEVLPRSGAEKEQIRPDAGRARLAGRLDNFAELLGPKSQGGW